MQTFLQLRAPRAPHWALALLIVFLSQPRKMVRILEFHS